MVCHNPEDEQEGEKAQDVCEEDHALEHWQLVGTVDIETDYEEGESEHEQCGLPCLRKARVWVAGRD